MITVGILFGGRSGEHEVSRCSAASVFTYLDRAKYNVIAIGIDYDGRWYPQNNPSVIEHKDFGRVLDFKKEGQWLVSNFYDNGKLGIVDISSGNKIYIDVVFPVVHGTFCEDGTLQGFLDLSLVPYVGAGVSGSAIGMDKDVAKRLLKEAGLPVVPWKKVTSLLWKENRDSICDDIENEFGFPCFVKPANAGSSVGVSKVKSRGELGSAIDEAFLWDNKVLVERAINAREIEFSVLGNDSPIVSIAGEIRPKHEFYSYEAKYIDSNGAELVIPAKVDDAKLKEMQRSVLKAYLALECCGMARVDLFLDRDSGDFYINEINTIPGFTSISMYPKLWEHSGIKYGELLDRLIELALERWNRRLGLKIIHEN
ncbi:MAG TPA: D-alanine--D-alanine ligase family protein [Spirochaetota bacterium]|nr:D-alanine--D-alanine ligase family protein [Spirochaetota bacterium]HPP95708.1 D-alanine--D-alanine ligase family protein [Spirochaetota bacterium]